MPEVKKIPRIVTFDIMRGFFLIAILNTHLALFPNFVDWWGMRGDLLVTTAEGFFLLSGVVLGLVRGAKLIDQPMAKVNKLVLGRAWTLYLTHIVMVILFTLISWYIFAGNPNVKYGVMSPDHPWWILVWKTVSLQYLYGWADYLRFYAMYIAISPLAFWLLRRGKWYVVVLVSFLIYFIFPIDRQWDWQYIALVQPVSWQVIFFNGLVIGFHWPQITHWCARHRTMLTRYVAWPATILGVALLTWNTFAVFAPDFINTAWAHGLSYEAWLLRTTTFHKEQMPFVRFALFMLWFWTAFFLVNKFEKPIVKYVGWLLIPFGTNSLYVYTLDAAIIYFVHIYFAPASIWQNFALTVGCTALTYLAIRKKFLMKIIPR